MDRHKIWRLVRNNYAQLAENAPHGFAPVVEVFLLGRSEPVRLGEVQTSRDPEFRWALLIARTQSQGEGPSENEHLIFAAEEHIESVEIRFERSDGRRTDFALGMGILDPSTNGDEPE
jgi:hypothetical protein